MSKYQGIKHVTRTLTYRLKTSTRLTAYFYSMESESHVWLNAGLQAKNIGATFIDCARVVTLVSTIPQAFAYGAIQVGIKMQGSCVSCGSPENVCKCKIPDVQHKRVVPYGNHTYPLYSARPLGKKSTGNVVYFPCCSVPFYLQKGELPKDSQSYKIVDVTNHSDKERQFELHVTIREHVPDRVCTGVSAGVDMGGHHTMVVAKSDGTADVLSLREKITLNKIRGLHQRMSRCTAGSRKYVHLKKQLNTIYRKMKNRQRDKLRKFAKKLFEQCDKIIFEGMGLDTLTRAGPGQTEKNKKMRQSKCGEARNYIAYGSTRHNVEYAEVNPRNTSKMCFMCCGYNTLREDRKLTCHDCRKTIHADVNAAFNILYTYSIVWWSARIRSVQKLQREVRLASRGQIHLDTGITPPVVGATLPGTRKAHYIPLDGGNTNSVLCVSDRLKAV